MLTAILGAAVVICVAKALFYKALLLALLANLGALGIAPPADTEKADLAAQKEFVRKNLFKSIWSIKRGLERNA
jgi:hypothetical protein